MKENSQKTYYKFLQLDDKGNIVSNYDKSKWEIGKWRKTTKTPVNCKAGFHCSKEIYQAFSYVAGEVLAEVEVAGKSDVGNDKVSYQQMRIVRAWKWDKVTSVKLAIYAAEQVIKIYEKEYPDDKRPRKAIQAAKRYLKDPSKENSDAADAAAYAARAAAYAARAAAYAAYAARAADAAADAARAARAADAAADAARAARAARAADAAAYAARAAAYAAYAARAADAADAALIKKINAYMNKLAKDLKEIK